MKIFLLYFWINVDFLWSILAESSRDIYTNQWAVEILTSLESANEIAERNGFKNLGKIGSLEHYYLFEHKRVRKRSLFLSGDKYSLLKDDPEIVWCQQQKVKRRVKRGLNKLTFSDPLWPRMWYLNRKGENMNVMGAWMHGYTGKGTVVAILDDGIEHNHTDLVRNYDPLASYDLIDNDDDPMPSYGSPNDNNHGTRCAGEVAAVADNRKCMVGVAFDAKIGGVRILEGDGDVTDAMEATAFGFKMNYIDIYSASWGPEDNGEVVDGPDKLANEALLYGVSNGRNGKGSIYIWASGNGGSLYDSCSCDGYASSLYTFSIGGVTENGRKPWYLEECSSTLATTYSSGDAHKERKIMTIDLFNHCGEHSGTSSSAAMAAGMCALALQANQNLTWRDIQYIVLLTARKSPLKDAVWVKNGAGRLVSHGFGYGLMDGLAMVKLAEQWVTVPEWHNCWTEYQFLDLNFTDSLETNMSTYACWNTSSEINYLEHVEATVWLKSSQRGSVQLSLTSPNGTTSILLPRREKDLSPGMFKNWTFMSVFYWGENPTGEWRLNVKNVGKADDHEGVLHGWQLKFHGTESYPINVTEPEQTLNTTYLEETTSEMETSIPEQTTGSPVDAEGTEANSTFEKDGAMLCHKECFENTCLGPSGYNCSSCKNFKLLDGACVSSCPNNSYANLSKVCLPCPQPCQGCEFENNGIKCTGCRSPFFYKLPVENESSCTQSCDAGTYGDVKSRKCLSCLETCIDCQDGHSCSECVKGYELLSSHCYSPCNQSDFRAENKSCMPCHESCRTCSGPDVSDCVTCSHDRLWEGDLCVLNCSQGFYFEDSNKKLPICEMCHISCHTCSGPRSSDCTSCVTPFKFYNNTCIEKCPFTFYPSQDVCLYCNSNCFKCVGPEEFECTECEKPRVLFEGRCMERCPNNSYFVDIDPYTNKVVNKCYKCHPTCKSCIGASGMQCSSCKEGLYYAYGQCVKKCTTREFEQHGKCLKCHRSCLTCSGPLSDNCLDCYSDMYLLLNSCLSFCPETYYPSGNLCSKCGDDCRTCLEYMPKFCTSCMDGESPKSGKCEKYIIPCEINYFYNNTVEECQSCYAGCAECLGPRALDCTTCQTSHVLHPTTSACFPCCSDSIRYSCCSCHVDSNICHEFIEDIKEYTASTTLPTPSFDYDHRTTAEATLEVTVVSISSTESTSTEIAAPSMSTSFDQSLYSVTSMCNTSYEQTTSTVYATSIDYSTSKPDPTTGTPEQATPSPKEPISLFSIILSTCLALLVLLAIASVVAFCLFQAKAHNKLCWAKQRYQSVDLWYMSNPNPKKKKTFTNDKNYPPVNV